MAAIMTQLFRRQDHMDSDHGMRSSAPSSVLKAHNNSPGNHDACLIDNVALARHLLMPVLGPFLLQAGLPPRVSVVDHRSSVHLIHVCIVESLDGVLEQIPLIFTILTCLRTACRRLSGKERLHGPKK
mmetsp:Transcript_18184/g.28211  ORF Transcript_18184/g.28211 Transcript_18184/m.28211 type:complete len:128 (+) Transcript_18184:263-646(+)